MSTKSGRVRCTPAPLLALLFLTACHTAPTAFSQTSEDDGLVRVRETYRTCSGLLDGGDWAECKTRTVIETYDAGELHERQRVWKEKSLATSRLGQWSGYCASSDGGALAETFRGCRFSCSSAQVVVEAATPDGCPLVHPAERQLAWDAQRDCDESDGGAWEFPLTLTPALGGGEYVLRCEGGHGTVVRRDNSLLPSFPPYSEAETLRHEQRRAHSKWATRCATVPREPEVVGGCRFSCQRDRVRVDAVEGQRCPISELRPRPVGDFPGGENPN